MFKISFDRFNSAIYILYKNGEIYYIGKSVNVFGRIGQHEKTFDMQFDRVDIYPCEDFYLQSLERELIELYQPVRNSQLTRGDFAKMPIQERIKKFEKDNEITIPGEKSIDDVIYCWIAESKKSDKEYSEESMKCKNCVHSEPDVYHGLPVCECDLGCESKWDCLHHNQCYYIQRRCKNELPPNIRPKSGM